MGRQIRLDAVNERLMDAEEILLEAPILRYLEPQERANVLIRMSLEQLFGVSKIKSLTQGSDNGAIVYPGDFVSTLDMIKSPLKTTAA